MPGEIDEQAITERIKELWTDTLALHAPSGRLITGESVDDVLRKSRYTATLRDFYNDDTRAKLALWCAQAYYTADNGRMYCLSVQYDSRTGEAYALSCALYGSVRDGQGADALIPFLTANGYADTLSARAALTTTEKGSVGTLLLPDGLTVSIVYVTGEQYEIAFAH